MECLPVWDHWDAMVVAAVNVLHSRDQAHECASEAMAQVLQRRPADVANLEAFMVTVAKRRAIDHHRSQVRSRRRDARLVGQTTLTVPDVAEDITARAEAAWVDEQARLLLKPQVYGLVRQLADGVPMHEAALALGMTTRSAESHLLRARRTLRAALAKTLALLGGLLAWIRRGSAAATITTTAAAATALLVVLPWAQPDAGLQPSPETTIRVEDGRSIGGQRVVGSARAVRTDRASVTSVRRVHRALTAPVTAAAPPGTTVKTPVAGVRTYNSDDGAHSDTPVEQIQHCVQNLRVSTSYVGCERQP